MMPAWVCGSYIRPCLDIDVAFLSLTNDHGPCPARYSRISGTLLAQDKSKKKIPAYAGMTSDGSLVTIVGRIPCVLRFDT